MREWKTFIIIIIAIFGLTFAVYWQFKGFQESLTKVSLPEFEMPEIEFPALEEGVPEEIGYKEFVTPDNKLKIKYPASWVKGGEEFLKAMGQEEIMPGAKVLFFAYKVELEKLERLASAFLMVQEINLTNLDEIIEVMKQDVQNKGGEMEIISLEKKDEIVSLETRYKREGYNLHSKEKIFLLKEKSYLVAFFTTEEDWLEMAEEADSILNSIEFFQ